MVHITYCSPLQRVSIQSQLFVLLLLQPAWFEHGHTPTNVSHGLWVSDSVTHKKNIFCSSQFKLEWEYMLKKCFVLCLIVTLYIAAFSNCHSFVTHDETCWFWTAYQKNARMYVCMHVVVCPFLIRSSVFTVYFSLTLLFPWLLSFVSLSCVYFTHLGHNA